MKDGYVDLFLISNSNSVIRPVSCGQKVTAALHKLNVGIGHLLSNGLLIEHESLSREDFDDYREAKSTAMTKKIHTLSFKPACPQLN